MLGHGRPAVNLSRCRLRRRVLGETIRAIAADHGATTLGVA